MWLSSNLDSYYVCVCMCPLQNLVYYPMWNVILDIQIHYCFYPKMAKNAISDQLNFKIFLGGHAPRPPCMSFLWQLSCLWQLLNI